MLGRRSSGPGFRLLDAVTLGASIALMIFAIPTFAATLYLNGTDGSGFLSLSGVNSESVEPNTAEPGSKEIDYPYYLDSASNVYEIIVAEPLSSGSTYQEESSQSVVNKSVTDADFGDFSLGTITYDAGLVSRSGTSVIAASEITLALDAGEFDPLNTDRNVNNEFAWTYQINAQNLGGDGLTFVDGILTDIDLVADIHVDVFFLGQPNLAMTPGFSAPAALRIEGDRIRFSLDQTEDQQSPLGSLDGPRLTISRTGTFDGIGTTPLKPTSRTIIQIIHSLLLPEGD